MLDFFRTQSPQYQASEILSKDNQVVLHSKVSIVTNAKDVETAINALYFGLVPMLYAEQSVALNGTLVFLKGKVFIQAAHEFYSNQVSYPNDGMLTEFRGQYFSELPHRYKRKLLEAEIPVTYLVCSSANDGKVDSFRKLIDQLLDV